MNPLKIQDNTFRDGHQSIYATRMRTEDMIPIAEAMDEIGFWSVEAWGGATFSTRASGSWPRTPGNGSAGSRRPCPTPGSRCSSAARTCWGTAITPTTWSGRSSRCPPSRRRYLPGLRRAERSPQPGEREPAASRTGRPAFQAAIGYTISPAEICGPVFNEEYCRQKAAPDGRSRRRLDLHQGHGRHDHGRRTRATWSPGSRIRPACRSPPLALDLGRIVSMPVPGRDRRRGRHPGHGHVAGSRSGPPKPPDRVGGRLASRRDRL